VSQSAGVFRQTSAQESAGVFRQTSAQAPQRLPPRLHSKQGACSVAAPSTSTLDRILQHPVERMSSSGSFPSGAPRKSVHVTVSSSGAPHAPNPSPASRLRRALAYPQESPAQSIASAVVAAAAAAGATAAAAAALNRSPVDAKQNAERERLPITPPQQAVVAPPPSPVFIDVDISIDKLQLEPSISSECLSTAASGSAVDVTREHAVDVTAGSPRKLSSKASQSQTPPSPASSSVVVSPGAATAACLDIGGLDAVRIGSVQVAEAKANAALAVARSRNICTAPSPSKENEDAVRLDDENCSPNRRSHSGGLVARAALKDCSNVITANTTVTTEVCKPPPLNSTRRLALAPSPSKAGIWNDIEDKDVDDPRPNTPMRVNSTTQLSPLLRLEALTPNAGRRISTQSFRSWPTPRTMRIADDSIEGTAEGTASSPVAAPALDWTTPSSSTRTSPSEGREGRSVLDESDESKSAEASGQAEDGDSPKDQADSAHQADTLTSASALAIATAKIRGDADAKAAVIEAAEAVCTESTWVRETSGGSMETSGSQTSVRGSLVLEEGKVSPRLKVASKLAGFVEWACSSPTSSPTVSKRQLSALIATQDAFGVRRLSLEEAATDQFVIAVDPEHVGTNAALKAQAVEVAMDQSAAATADPEPHDVMAAQVHRDVASSIRKAVDKLNFGPQPVIVSEHQFSAYHTELEEPPLQEMQTSTVELLHDGFGDDEFDNVECDAVAEEEDVGPIDIFDADIGDLAILESLKEQDLESLKHQNGGRYPWQLPIYVPEGVGEDRRVRVIIKNMELEAEVPSGAKVKEAVMAMLPLEFPMDRRLQRHLLNNTMMSRLRYEFSKDARKWVTDPGRELNKKAAYRRIRGRCMIPTLSRIEESER